MSTFEDFMISETVGKDKEIHELRQRLLATKQALKEANKKIEALTPKLVNLELLPPPTDVRSRFEQFKEMLVKFYKHINFGKAPVWDAGDAKQLNNLLKARPELTKEEFREWLLNYMDSQNVNFPDRPRKFLPNITSYANGPLDKYGKPLVVQKRRIL
jgi:hypothetical protein